MNFFEKHGKVIKALIPLFLLVAGAVSFWSFSEQAFQNSRLLNQSHLVEVSDQISATINAKLDSSLQYVRGAADSLSKFADPASPEAQKLLLLLSADSPFDRMWITTPDGNSLAPGVPAVDSSNELWFKDCIFGESGFSAIDYSPFTHEPVVCVYAPIFRGGKIVAAVHGVYNSVTFLTTAKITSFNGEGFSQIFSGNGDIFLSSRTGNNSAHTSNIFEIMERASFLYNYSFNDLVKEIKDGRCGTCVYMYDGNIQYASYSPVGVNDWYVFTSVPETYISQYAFSTTELAARLALKLLLMMAILTLFILHYERRFQRKISSALRELTFLSNNLPGGVQKCTADGESRFLYMSDGFLSLTGFSKEDIHIKFNDRFLEMLHPEDREHVSSSLENCRQENDSGTIDFRLVKKDGEFIWVADHFRFMREGEQVYYYGILFDISESKKAVEALKVSHEQYRIAISQSAYVSFEYDPVQRHVTNYYDRLDLYGLPEEMYDVPESLIRAGFIAEESAREVLRAYALIQSGAETASFDAKVKTPSGTRWQRVHLTNIFVEPGRPVRSIGIIQDITHEKEAARRLIEEAKYRSAVGPDTLLICELNLTRVQASSTFSENVNSDFLEPSSYFDPSRLLFTCCHPLDSASVNTIFSIGNLWSCYHRGELELRCQYRVQGRIRAWLWVESVCHLFENPQTSEVYAIAYVRNIDPQQRRELELRRRAEHDMMTALYNRSTFEEQVSERLASAALAGERSAFLIIDIDHFKTINDSFGHVTGDSVLKKVSDILLKKFRRIDLLGRLGGDEFGVLLSPISSDELAQAKAASLVRSVDDAFPSGEGCPHVSISVGISFMPTDGQSFDELFRKADAALYHVKDFGRDGYFAYNESLSPPMHLPALTAPPDAEA